MNAHSTLMLGLAAAGLIATLPAEASSRHSAEMSFAIASVTSASTASAARANDRAMVLAKRGSDDGNRGSRSERRDDNGRKGDSYRDDDDRGYGYGYERRHRSSDSDRGASEDHRRDDERDRKSDRRKKDFRR